MAFLLHCSKWRMNVLYAVVQIQRYSSVEIFLRGPLYRAAMIRNHKPVLEASTKSKLPANPIKYHRSCRAEFTNKRDLQVANEPSDDAATGSAPRRSSRERNEVSSTILPDQCLFCKKSKCKPGKYQNPREATVSRNCAPMRR